MVQIDELDVVFAGQGGKLFRAAVKDIGDDVEILQAAVPAGVQVPQRGLKIALGLVAHRGPAVVLVCSQVQAV